MHNHTSAEFASFFDDLEIVPPDSASPAYDRGELCAEPGRACGSIAIQLLTGYGAGQVVPAVPGQPSRPGL
jgi:hypothetical protein